MHFKSGLELTELQNMTVPEDDNVSNDSNDFTEVENGQINSKFISDRESRRSLTNSHLEKRKCDEYIPGTTSLGMSVFNLSNAIMGSGILGLAFALANTGILLFLDTSDFCDTAVYIFNKPTSDLLQGNRCCMVYEKLGEQVFGTTGKLVIFGATSLQNTGAMLSYLFIVKNELPSAIKSLMGEEDAFSAWYNLGYLGYTSGFSLSCMVFFLIVVIYKKFQTPCENMEQNSTISANVTDACTPKYVTFNSKTVYALPTIAFAFVCHPSVLPIYSELKDRSQKKMQMVSNISFFAMFVMYFLTAIFGYLTFYDKVQSDLLHKYQSTGDILILTVRLAVIVAVILTVPVLFFTGSIVVFELAKKTKFHLCRHVLVTIILLVIINLLVIFIPSMKDIFGVVGAALFLGLGVLFSLISIPLVIYDWACSSGNDEGH
ncbi:Sodium-coupled neutral amino acid transporter 1 [Apodemus speciosus]|uniref:Sodium-coupled neutral amino acid transporter 1 n=1 Tax=Apodemus speciosus TaxID=105296 RepID=A0ABQ0FKL1_APOSI